ncbi:MAG: hypothetical protein RMK57_08280 [Bryobacterales bacterium]|nr:hypothetical protein [Bryobacteraceae bacterium]MDW8354513.1 hypothetical protein [Bryobacterales bacterium]
MQHTELLVFEDFHPSGSGFRTAVCLHGHTLHSREPLSFLTRLCAQHPILGWAISLEEARCRAPGDPPVDFARLWWTPPLCPRQAWQVEADQIENGLGLKALVSLTDHDSIEAPLALSLVREDAPISFEWTVHYGPTFFHLGIHNLPRRRAAAWFAEMAEATRERNIRRAREILAALDREPGVLTVFNHPLWDEARIGQSEHRRSVHAFLRDFGRWIHALEMNAFRPDHEIRGGFELSRQYDLPVVAGGDRHGRSPAMLLNLTACATLAEFIEEVRVRRRSTILALPPHREPRRVRILRSMVEILEEAPDHVLGWTRWSDRVFFDSDQWGVVPVSAYFPDDRPPALVRWFLGTMRVVERLLLANPKAERLRRPLLGDPVGEEAFS